MSLAWIPTEEKLPPKGELVLAYNKEDGMYIRESVGVVSQEDYEAALGSED